MKKALILSFLLGTTMMAAERVKVDKLIVKTLPAEVYAKLEKGKKLSLLWKDPSFAPGRGFKVGEIQWKAEVRNGEVSSYLKEQAPDLGSKSGFYTVDLAVTEAAGGDLGYLWNKTGFFVLEGQVRDSDGHVVAAFITKEEDEFGGMAKTLKPGVDRALSGIGSELFKK